MPITISLTTDAERVLRSKVPKGRYGAGAYVSALILAENAREELRRELESQRTRPVSRQAWESSGVRVD